MRKLMLALVVASVGVVAAAPASAQSAPPPPPVPTENAAPPPEVAHKYVGVGFKIGNGMGFVGGDLIISPIDHLTIDLQASYLSTGVSGGGTATGYGLAPMLQGHLFGGQRSSPYLGAGLLYATISLDGVTASGSGAAANVGYEWRWDSGAGILLGGGIGYLGNIHATDGVTTVDAPAVTHFNIEAGFRFMFL